MNESPFRFIQDITREHRLKHKCNAYTYSDGQGLIDLAKTFKPERILELGTALGYTACCLAASGDNCLVDTIEADPEHVKIAKKNIAQVKLSEKITIHEGDFTGVTKSLPDGYDIIFFDGLASATSLLLLLYEKLREGGGLICANFGFAQPGCREMLNNKDYWMPAGMLEGGDTLAVTKITNVY
jgi:predicted O-methyltransferase YrrM